MALEDLVSEPIHREDHQLGPNTMLALIVKYG